jgi:hypothetical protein
LSGRGSSAFEQSRLYLGPDHLLLVTSSGYSESYRRFYLRDIQAITVRKTVRGQVWNSILAFLTLLAVIIAFQLSGAAMFIWSGIAGILLALLAVNFGRGPTCLCQIRTAVQIRPLPPLNRLRRARRVIAQLRPLIVAAQEPMSPEEMNQRIEQDRRGLGVGATVAAPIAASEASPQPGGPSGGEQAPSTDPGDRAAS